MPGTVAINGSTQSPELEDALTAIRFTDRYSIERFYTRDAGFLGANAYSSYPIEHRQIDGCEVILEGYLYDLERPEEVICSAVAAVRERDLETLRNGIVSWDGDFLLTVYDPPGESITVLNDAFKRLPVYYGLVDGLPVVSREPKLIREYARQAGDPFELDPLGVAQTVAIGYTLGERTLFEGIRCLSPGHLLRASADEFETEAVYEHEFGRDAHEDRTSMENGRRLAELFTDACAARARRIPGRPIVSLSGGLDSRGSLAGYDAVDADPAAVTSTVDYPGSADETSVAEEVADILGVEIETYTVAPSARKRRLMREMTQGTNSLRMNFSIGLYERVLEWDEEVNLVTGDGGDKTVKSLQPSRQFDDIADLAAYIIEDEEFIELEDAADIACISPERLVRSIHDRLESYPEDSLEDRYVHWKVRERGLNWLNTGEDRTRGFLWTSTPFYSLPFFEYAMNVPDDQKSQNELQREFLTTLSRPLAEVDYYDYNAPITSLEFRIKKRAYTMMASHPRARKMGVRLLRSWKRDSGGSERTESDIYRMVADSLDDVERGSTLNSRAIQNLLEDESAYADRHLYKLYTIMSLVTEGSDHEGGEIRSATA